MTIIYKKFNEIEKLIVYIDLLMFHVFRNRDFFNGSCSHACVASKMID